MAACLVFDVEKRQDIWLGLLRVAWQNCLVTLAGVCVCVSVSVCDRGGVWLSDCRVGRQTGTSWCSWLSLACAERILPKNKAFNPVQSLNVFCWSSLLYLQENSFVCRTVCCFCSGHNVFLSQYNLLVLKNMPSYNDLVAHGQLLCVVSVLFALWQS